MLEKHLIDMALFMKSRIIDNTSTHLDKLAEATKEYVEPHVRSYQASGLKQLASTGSVFLTLAGWVLLLFVSFAFANVAFAVVASHYLGSIAVGFGLFGAFYLLLGVCFIVMQKKVQQ